MAIRREALTDVFREIYEREPAITSADVLLEFAKRNPIARHHRVNHNDATAFLRPEGRAQVYKRVPVEWPGRISKPTETDVRFDLDLWDGRTCRKTALAASSTALAWRIGIRMFCWTRSTRCPRAQRRCTSGSPRGEHGRRGWVHKQ